MGIIRLKEVLKEKGVTATLLAENLGVSNNTITRVANDTSKPSMDLLIKISEALDVDIRELFRPSKGGALLNGFIEYRGDVYRISNSQDLSFLLNLVEKNS